jgi:HK97 family phage portal protein
MFWFGRKSAGRAVARPVFSHVYANSSNGQWPRGYEAQVQAGYMDNAIAQRAVRLVAEGVASAPIVSSDPKALALLNATSGGQALIETIATHLLLHGNAYVGKLMTEAGALVELYAHRPELMAVERDANGWPMGFTYRGGAKPMSMAADSVIHIRTIHPLDDHYGLGCLGAASGAIATHNAATRWNKALLDNAARPSGALVAEGDPLTADQFDRLKTELAEGFQGSANAGRPMVLEGGIKWQSMAMTPADMDFIRLKENAAREIALAFGVPPMLLGLPGDATYANYREANKALWRQAILPIAAKLLDAIAEGVQAHFPGLTLSIDLDHVPALSEDRERLWAQVTAADFLEPSEKRSILGLSPTPEREDRTS